MNRAFTNSAMSQLEPRIREITRGLVDRIVEKGNEFDLIEDLAIPLPVTIIAEMLGVDAEHRQDFKRWSDAITGARASLLMQEGDARKAHEARVLKSCQEFIAYFSEAIEKKRREPQNDLISVLVTAEKNALLDPTELINLTRLLLIAGNETTTNLLGNTLLALQVPFRAREGLRECGAHPQSRRGGASLRWTGDRAFSPGHPGRRDRRHSYPQGWRRDAVIRLRKSRRAEIPGPGDLQYPARYRGASCLRARHPLLRGRALGAARSQNRARRAFQPVDGL